MAKLAVIQTGGKQYIVSDGDIVTVEKIAAGKSGKVTFDTVLLVDDGKEMTVGMPHLSGAKVTGEVISESRGKKISVIRYRQKSRYFKKKGHRQVTSKIKITALP